jgi:hypothetical protein
MVNLAVLAMLAALLSATTVSYTTTTPSRPIPTAFYDKPSISSMLDEYTRLRVDLLVLLEHQKSFVGTCKVVLQLVEDMDVKTKAAADWRKEVGKCERMIHLAKVALLVERDLEDTSRYITSEEGKTELDGERNEL